METAIPTLWSYAGCGPPATPPGPPAARPPAPHRGCCSGGMRRGAGPAPPASGSTSWQDHYKLDTDTSSNGCHFYQALPAGVKGKVIFES
jgi:hypothetical protein